MFASCIELWLLIIRKSGKKLQNPSKYHSLHFPCFSHICFSCWHHLWRRNHFGLHLLGDRYHCGYFVWISPELFSRWKIENQGRIGWPDVWRGQHGASNAWRQFNSETWKYLEITSWTISEQWNVSQIYHLNATDFRGCRLGSSH